MTYAELYAARIRSLCKQRGISINKLAEMSNVRQSSINKLAEMSNVRQSSIDNIVNGRTHNPGVVNLHKIACTLNMTLAEFLDFKELNAFSFDDNEEE